MNKSESYFKIGDVVHDFHAIGTNGIGTIVEIKYYPPRDNPLCWNGGYLYKHTGRGCALPEFVAKESLEIVSRCDEKNG